jgi:hypothetical protein
MSLLYHCDHCRRIVRSQDRFARFCPFCASYLDGERQFCRECRSESTPNERGAVACLCCGERALTPGVGFTVVDLKQAERAFYVLMVLLSFLFWEDMHPGWVSVLGSKAMKYSLPSLPPDVYLCAGKALGAIVLGALLGPMIYQVFDRDRVSAMPGGVLCRYLGKHLGWNVRLWLRVVRCLRLNPRRSLRVLAGRVHRGMRRAWELLKRSWEEASS